MSDKDQLDAIMGSVLEMRDAMLAHRKCPSWVQGRERVENAAHVFGNLVMDFVCASPDEATPS